VPLLAARDEATYRYVLSVFNYIRTLKGDGTVDIKSIVSPSTCKDSVVQDILSWIHTEGSLESLLRGFQSVSSANEWTMPHLSTKSGPNGQAIGTALRDLQLSPS
jgi:hypothetical protein